MDHSREPIISLLAAVADNGVIGRAGDMPWHLPADLKHFKTLTTDHTIVMGRRTFESIGPPLPRRRSIVITHQTDYAGPGVEVAGGLDEAIGMCHGDAEVFIIGGRSVYEAALPRADRLYLTRVHGRVEGDVYFPAFDPAHWRLTDEQHHPADADHAYAMTIQTLVRVR